MMYTKKQRELLKLWQEGRLARINILEGAVRSGKTWISLVLWMFFAAGAPKDAPLLMAGKTLTTLKRNALDILSTLSGGHFTYSLSKKEGLLFGRKVYLEGVSDARSENKIRGMSLYGAYCDELSLFPEAFFNMLLSRLSMEGAKCFATTNPDSPNHWLKRKFLDRSDLDLLRVRFSMEDNTFLPADYIENLKREYTGVFYKRFVLGEWAAASGLVYPMFSEEKHVKALPMPDTGLFYISVDYGTLNPCSMGLWFAADGKAYRLGEYYYDGRKTSRLKTDAEYYGELERLAGSLPIQYVVVDPSAASFMEEIRRHGRFSVRKANNRVLDGIRRVSTLLTDGKILINPHCKAIIKEFSEYVWDEDAGEDRVIKECDHAMDDMRYFISTVRL